MATSTQIQTWLTEAEAARHALALGQTVREYGRDGRRMAYAGMSLDDLDRYIEKLQRDLSAALADESGASRRRPIGLAWRN